MIGTEEVEVMEAAVSATGIEAAEEEDLVVVHVAAALVV